MRQILMTILGLLICSNYNLSYADNDVNYKSEMEEYIGTWICESSQIDPQFVPNKIEIKKKGKKLKWTFFRNGSKAPKDFYDGPYLFLDGHFNFSSSPIYRDLRPSQQHKIKYDFKTHMRYDDRTYTSSLYIYSDALVLQRAGKYRCT